MKVCCFPDKPDKPGAPLDVVEIHKEGCKVKWKKPNDDGGLPLTGYVVEQMDAATRRWVTAKFVDPNNNECEITGLKKRHRYEFRVKAVNEAGESQPLSTDTPIVLDSVFS